MNGYRSNFPFHPLPQDSKSIEARSPRAQATSSVETWHLTCEEQPFSFFFLKGISGLIQGKQKDDLSCQRFSGRRNIDSTQGFQAWASVKRADLIKALPAAVKNSIFLLNIKMIIDYA